MSINVVPAKIIDIDSIECIAQQCFDKFKLSNLGLEYLKEDVIKKMNQFINNENFLFLKAIFDGEIVGFSICAITDTLYSFSQKQITEFAMQSLPILSQSFQSKVILSLIQNIESYADNNNISLCAFSICPNFDIGSNLSKKGYVLSDKVFLKNMEVK